MARVLAESKRVPASVNRRIAQAGGYNVFGEPNFRVVWGADRLTMIGGKWEDHDADQVLIRTVFEYRWVPKHAPFERFHLERWVPGDFYGSPADWAEKTREIDEETGRTTELTMGAYPSRGEYEHCMVIEWQGGYVDLTPSMVDYMIRALNKSRQMVHESKLLALDALRKRQAKVGEDWSDYADEVMDDCFDAFHGQPFVPVRAPGTPQIPA